MSEEPKKEEKKDSEPKFTEQAPVEQKMKVDGHTYRVVTGFMPMRAKDDDEIEAQIFHTAYLREGVKDARKRPLMFVFNGGPGSPSLWLHLGAVGPRRVKMRKEGGQPQPPFEIVENPHNWLGEADLVFIDPVGTGWSRAKDEETGKKKHWGVKQDIESVGEFIRLFLVRHQRFASPLYMAGESYGTTRATGVAGHLIDQGIAFSGIILVSSILSFLTARFTKGNDLPYALFLPTYAATAHYHGKATGKLQDHLKKAREFAIGPYWTALAKGSDLQGKERERVKKTLSSLVGLSTDYLEKCDLRPEIMPFCKELMRDEGMTVGRLDSRFRGYDAAQSGNDYRPEHDPSMTALMAPYAAAYQHYARTELGFETDLAYEIFGGVKDWDTGKGGDGFPDTSEALRKAMARNPYMRVMIASGYYDLATPFFATEYTVSHLGLPEELRGNIETHEYRAGHMMYIDEGSLESLQQDLNGFMGRSQMAAERAGGSAKLSRPPRSRKPRSAR